MVHRAVRAMTPTSRVEQRGFTLLELLVVLSIIALGVGLIAPNIGLTDNSMFNAEVRQAAATLTYARRLAIVQGSPVTAQLATGVAQEQLQDAPAEARNRHWHSALLQLQYQDDLGARPRTVQAVPVTFYPQGGSTGGSLYFSRDERRAVISVNPVTGRISIGWDGEEPADDA